MSGNTEPLAPGSRVTFDGHPGQWVVVRREGPEPHRNYLVRSLEPTASTETRDPVPDQDRFRWSWAGASALALVPDERRNVVTHVRLGFIGSSPWVEAEISGHSMPLPAAEPALPGAFLVQLLSAGLIVSDAIAAQLRVIDEEIASR